LVHVWSREGTIVGIVRHSKLESRSARARLTRGRQPHWQALEGGRHHLGWQRWPEDRQGRWVLRQYLGERTYRVQTVGVADDEQVANGQTILSFAQAQAAARDLMDKPKGKVSNLTVRQAWQIHIDYKRNRGQSTADIESRGRVHILPDLGNLLVADLTAERLRKWLARVAATPAQLRPKDGKPKYKKAPSTDEEVRARRASANRCLGILRALLNFAYDEGHVSHRDRGAGS
jgi:hypothetical protein